MLVECPDVPEEVIKYKRKFVTFFFSCDYRRSDAELLDRARTGWIRWLDHGQFVLFGPREVFIALVLFSDATLATLIRGTGALVVLEVVIEWVKQLIDRKIQLAYRRSGYESIP